jgi:hypothetical protein
MSNLNLFSQIISKIDRNSFRKLVKEKDTDKHQKGYDSWTYVEKPVTNRQILKAVRKVVLHTFSGFKEVVMKRLMCLT